MKTNRYVWPALLLFLTLLWGPLPVLAGVTLPTDGGQVVELGPDEYDVPVAIEDPLVPAGLELAGLPQRTFGLVIPVYLSVVTVGFPDQKS